MNIYDVIRRPLLTEKGQYIKEKENKILLEVHPDANKKIVKDAVEKVFNVKVEKVNIIIQKPKSVKYGRYEGRTSKIKKAIVTLKKGEKLDFIEGV